MQVKSKKKVDITEKLEKQDFDLFQALGAIDMKNYDWYKHLSDEQKKKFSPYMLLQWLAMIKDKKTSSYYLLSSEYYSNTHLFNEKVQNHPELQWLMLCASSPGIGKQYRQWIPSLNNKVSQYKILVKSKEIYDYFEKIYNNADKNLLSDISLQFTLQQNLKFRLAKIYPNMKISDIELLSQFITDDDLNKYDQDTGNS